MDFSKPIRSPGTRARPPPLDIPGGEDADGAAGSDFWVWKNILPESPGKANNVSNPMSVVGPGVGAGTSLASKLHWRARGETDHQQVEIKVGESVVSVDREMAPLIQLLNSAGIPTATSCIGTAETWGYIMLIGVDSMQRFLRVWQRYLVPLGHPMPVLEFTARDECWRADIHADYPFPRPVPADEEDLTYTAQWMDHAENVRELVPHLAWALRRHLRESAEKKRRNLQG
jgi:hypothetical protein